MVSDSLWKLFGMILIVLLIFVVPTQFFYQRQDDISYQIVVNECHTFSDRVREQGYLTEAMVADFRRTLSATGISYAIEIEHDRKRFLNNQVYYDAIYHDDIMEALEGQDTYPLAVGDFFFVRVVNTSPTMSRTLAGVFGIGGQGQVDIYMKAGGVVRYGHL